VLPLAGLLPAAACSGAQSALDPAGPQAESLYRLGVFSWIAAAGVFAAVLAALLAALLRSRRRGEGDAAAVRPPFFPPPVEFAHADPMPVRVPVAVPDDRGGLLDLNSADAVELSQLPGIGRLAAERIVAHRDEYGRFASVADLSQVDGFDAQRIRRLEEHLTVQ
jgi:competence ComEA-like helix-hairpin-helix protein